MNKEEIDKWLDEQYGCSYTRLEVLHDFYFEKYTDLKQENQHLKEELKAVRKGLSKVSVKRNKWKNRYYKEKKKNRRAIKYIKEHKTDHRHNFRSLVYADVLLQILDKGENNE